MEITSNAVISLIVKSGPFARFILLLISFFSVLTVGVFIYKFRAYKAALEKNRRFYATFTKTQKLTDLQINPDRGARGTLEEIATIGLAEYNRLLETVMAHQDSTISNFFLETQFSIIKDNLEKGASEAVQKADRYLVTLAITSSTCPLLGLLGTVWGIMHAFSDIGSKGTASLNVVAPGIAEALITTVWGIGVAIPALVAYNAFANRNRSIESEAYDFSAHLLNRIKIDFFELMYKREAKRGS
ncbi:MAG: hypothetical protein A2519_19385 [Candidatus Raymondbacteria bacterium RIFOXYD12_FULL_49_13]|uniref:MotA/TolQ/ExbB proton channel domain-containing protein n=1 Tax=Candidatus Raymondbacteria bacterium RIFOXYD12_FULL_49_13 TaxID=1817890 RepID=A0A1F7F4M7_UNCRA|nr:MAG: hypothetical protein A2519_19385 [Candidatus Raymondbacteria bacterium RIFOXYD12_FULL_49_13]